MPTGISDAEPTIRACVPADAVTLAVLAARLFTQAYGLTHPEPELSRYLAREFAPQRLTDMLADEDVSVFLAEGGAGDAIGYAILRATTKAIPDGVPGKRTEEITRFYVDSAWHGRGVARRLMNACEAEARRRGADTVWLAVWREALRPIAFYRRMGFEVVGMAYFKFGDKLDEDFVMARRLERGIPSA